MSSHAIRVLSGSASAALMVVLLAGCGAESRGVTVPRLGDPAAIPTWVHVAPTEFRAGEEVRIEVGIRNPTSLPVRLHATSTCVLLFVVKNSHHDVVAPMGIACGDVAYDFELAPGEHLTQEFTNSRTHRPAGVGRGVRRIGDRAQTATLDAPPVEHSLTVTSDRTCNLFSRLRPLHSKAWTP